MVFLHLPQCRYNIVSKISQLHGSKLISFKSTNYNVQHNLTNPSHTKSLHFSTTSSHRTSEKNEIDDDSALRKSISLLASDETTQATNSFVAGFRTAMSCLASAAVFLTTVNKSQTSNKYVPRGLTVSSFASLSIKPWPLVTVNIQVPSHAADAMRPKYNKESGGIEYPIFAINILPATSEAAQTCRALAGSLGKDVNPFTHPSIQPHLSPHEESAVLADSLVDALDNEKQLKRQLIKRCAKIPVFNRAKAILYCTLYKTIPVADHEIWVAKVLHVNLPKSSLVEVEDEKSALVYHNRKFHLIGSEIIES